MTNQTSSPYALFNNEAKPKTLKLLKTVNVEMIAEYKIEYYSRIIKLQKCVANTLAKHDGKILNKNILEKINNEINMVLPYEKYRYMAYHQKPKDRYERNKIYIYCHGSNDFEIDKYIADIILSESAKDRNSDKLLGCQKIDYQVIHNLNVRSIAGNIENLDMWEHIKGSSYDVQYRVDQINTLKKELDSFVKLFDKSESDYIHTNYSLMNLIKDNPGHNNNMISWLKKQDKFMMDIK